ncbi:MAG: hypothetical protein AAF235_12385, partial [Planctomycetota bacterium]
MTGPESGAPVSPLGRLRSLRSGRVRRVIGGIVAVLLLAAVGTVLFSAPDLLREARAAIAGAGFGLIALFVLLPVLNLLAVTGGFVVLTRRVGQVGGIEMFALLSSAWLLNYLPMRPGMIGRTVYHKTVNGIAVPDGVLVLAWGSGLSLAAGFMMGVSALPGALGIGGKTAALAFLLAPVLLALLGLGACTVAKRGAWRTPAALLFKQLDMLVWAIRYDVAFDLVGRPIGIEAAALIAAISQATLLVPITGNGLGLREWAVGLLAWRGGFGRDAGLLADVL